MVLFITQQQPHYCISFFHMTTCFFLSTHSCQRHSLFRPQILSSVQLTHIIVTCLSHSTHHHSSSLHFVRLGRQSSSAKYRLISQSETLFFLNKIMDFVVVVIVQFFGCQELFYCCWWFFSFPDLMSLSTIGG